MPKKSSANAAFTKMAAKGRKAMQRHRSDDTQYDTGGSLPAGIENGVARLALLKFDVFGRGDNKGQPYFMAQGIVVHPKSCEGAPIEGLRTSIGPEPLCETPQRSRESFDEHFAWVLNELRKLGLDTESLDFGDLPEACEALLESGVHFRFRTWKGSATERFPNPRVQHVWNGAVDYDPETDEYAGVEDDTEEEEEEAEEAEETEEAEEAETVLPYSDAELADAADAGDEDAAERIAEIAKNAGVDSEGYETWVDVLKAVQNASEEEEEKEEEKEEEEKEKEEELSAPEVGDVWLYKPPRRKKALEVEVTVVNVKKETVNAKSLDDGKLYREVPFAELEESE